MADLIPFLQTAANPGASGSPFQSPTSQLLGSPDVIVNTGQNADTQAAPIGGSTPPPTTTPTAPDPAAVAAAAQAAKIQSTISSGTTSALAQGDAGTKSAMGQIAGLGDTLDSNTVQGQSQIDQARKAIGLQQINSIKGLMNTIREGLRGTGVQLGNTGALDSSAAGAAARAYANYGNVQTNGINNTAATGNMSQDAQQSVLDTTTANGLDYIAKQRDAAIANIQGTAISALQNVANTVAWLGGDTSKLDVKGLQDQIIQHAQDQLAAVDQHIHSMVGAIHAATPDETATAAQGASNAGVVPSGQTAFQTAPSTVTPQATDLGGAPTSLIPLSVRTPRTTVA